MIEVFIITLLGVVIFLVYNYAMLSGYGIPVTLVILTAMGYAYSTWRE